MTVQEIIECSECGNHRLEYPDTWRDTECWWCEHRAAGTPVAELPPENPARNDTARETRTEHE